MAAREKPMIMIARPRNTRPFSSGHVVGRDGENVAQTVGYQARAQARSPIPMASAREPKKASHPAIRQRGVSGFPFGN